MELASRRSAALGASLIGAALVAITPMLTAEGVPTRAPEVALTAVPGDVDLLAPFEQALNSTADNAEAVFAANQVALNNLFAALSGDPATISENLQTALQAITLTDAPDDLVAAVTPHTRGGVTAAVAGDGTLVPVADAHGELFEGLVGGDVTLPPGPEGDFFSALVTFAASPLSGVLIGGLGPVISPFVALSNSVDEILASLSGPDADLTAAFTALLDTPADVIDGFFNGATLNLDSLIPALQDFVSDGTGGAEMLDSLSYTFGGLFSPGLVVDGVGGVTNGVGGSLLNGLGVGLSFFPPDDFAGGSIDIPGIGVGPIAAMAGLLDIIGQALSGDLLGAA